MIDSKTPLRRISYRLRFLMLLVLGLTLATGCSSTRQLEDESVRQMTISDPIVAERPDSDYQISQGDEIEILVWEHTSFNTRTNVSNTGTIAIPLIGEKEVIGYTQEEFKRELERDLAEYIAGEINLTVSIRSINNMQVSVYGMVTRPDNYPISGETSLFRVLSYAGGPTEEANVRGVQIYRRTSNPHSSTLDLTRYLESGDLESPNLMIRPGDIVYVPRKENVVREMSDFLRDVVLLFGIFRIFN